jgi:hypothetical protein
VILDYRGWNNGPGPDAGDVPRASGPADEQADKGLLPIAGHRVDGFHFRRRLTARLAEKLKAVRDPERRRF